MSDDLTRAIHAGCDAVVLAIDGNTREPVRCRYPACGRFCPSSQSGLAMLRSLASPSDEAVEATTVTLKGDPRIMIRGTKEQVHGAVRAALTAYHAHLLKSDAT